MFGSRLTHQRKPDPRPLPLFFFFFLFMLRIHVFISCSFFFFLQFDSSRPRPYAACSLGGTSGIWRVDWPMAPRSYRALRVDSTCNNTEHYDP